MAKNRAQPRRLAGQVGKEKQRAIGKPPPPWLPVSAGRCSDAGIHQLRDALARYIPACVPVRGSARRYQRFCSHRHARHGMRDFNSRLKRVLLGRHELVQVDVMAAGRDGITQQQSPAHVRADGPAQRDR